MIEAVYFNQHRVIARRITFHQLGFNLVDIAVVITLDVEQISGEVLAPGSTFTAQIQLGVNRGAVITDVDIKRNPDRMMKTVTIEVGNQLHVARENLKHLVVAIGDAVIQLKRWTCGIVFGFVGDSPTHRCSLPEIL